MCARRHQKRVVLKLLVHVYTQRGQQVREAVGKALAALAALPENVLDVETEASSDTPKAVGTPKSTAGTPKSAVATPKSAVTTPKSAVAIPKSAATSKAVGTPNASGTTKAAPSQRASADKAAGGLPASQSAEADDKKRSSGMSLSKALGLSKLKGAFSRDSGNKSMTSRCGVSVLAVFVKRVCENAVYMTALLETHKKTTFSKPPSSSENKETNSPPERKPPSAASPPDTKAPSPVEEPPSDERPKRSTSRQGPRQPLSRFRSQGGGNYDVAVEVFAPPPKATQGEGEGVHLSPMMLQQIQQQAYMQVRA